MSEDHRVRKISLLDASKRAALQKELELAGLDKQIDDFEWFITKLADNPELADQWKSRLDALTEHRQSVALESEKLRAEPLRAFVLADTKNEIAGDYLTRAWSFEDTENSYYVLELFVVLVRAGYAPPKWALLEIANWFEKHLQNPDPGFLTTYFGLTGHERERRVIRAKRALAVRDMGTLIHDYGLGVLAAADAVIEKHKLRNDKGKTLSKHTMKNYYRDNFQYEQQHVSILMSDADRTKFVQSFSPRIRRKLKPK